MTTRVNPVFVIQNAFPEMALAQAQELVGLGMIRSYPPETMLCTEGAVEKVFYILLEGEVRVTKVINDMEKRFLADLTPGAFFGEMALIHGAPRTATVVTKNPVMVLEIEKDHFDELVKRNSSVSIAMVKEVSRRLRENNDLAVEDLRLKAGELAAAYQRLAEVEFAKSEFLTIVAHELRTPLTVSSGFLEMVRSQKLPAETHQMALRTISENLQQIISLVNDILFLQEMDFILTEFQQTDVGGVVASVVERQRDRAAQCEVGLKLMIAPNLPFIQADQRSLERAIAAVLDNAIKFSPDGGDVEVRVDFDAAEVFVEVTDHGVGIPPEALPRVFDRFFHMEEVNGHLFRGVGLGLSIARQAVRVHQGEITVQSELGKGSKFTVRLPRLVGAALQV
jgi:signal transduction histidine kinase